MPPKEIELKIEKAESEGGLGIEDVAKVLKGLQDTIYHIGESLYIKKGFRTAGKRKRVIEKRTKLTFKNIEYSSFNSTIVGEPQEAIVGTTIADESIVIFGSVVYHLNTSDKPEEKIKDLLPDALHRARIIGDIASFWPGNENRYSISLQTYNFKRATLDPQKKQIISELAEYGQKEIKETTFGILGGGHFIGRERVFEIEGPDGKIKCKYGKELESAVLKNLKKPVIVEGMLTTATGRTIKVPKVISIKPLRQIPLDRIITEKSELKLKREIKLDVSYAEEDDMWLLKYPELEIVAYGSTYDEAIQDFQEDFIELYEHFVYGDESKMVGRALKIRKLLNELVEK